MGLERKIKFCKYDKTVNSKITEMRLIFTNKDSLISTSLVAIL